MACTDVQTIQAGNGTKTQFSFDFPYIFKSEIHVYFWNAVTKEYDEKLTTDATYPWQITDANPTIVEFTGTAPPSPATPVDPNEPTVDNVKIRRITKVDDIRALFNPGSAIRSDDLNKNFEQLRYAIQESNCVGIPDDVDDYLKTYYWNNFDSTVYSTETWDSDDDQVATTAAIDARIDSKVDDALTLDIIGADGVSVTDDTPGSGQITIGLSDDSVDFDKIKDADQIKLADQTADYDNAGSDDKVFTSLAAIRRFENYVQTSTPTPTAGIGKGAVWLDNDQDLTLSVWNGSAWIGVASGGTFTNQPKVVYVDASSGDDNNDGHRISRPKASIKAAVNQINADSTYGDGSVVIVAAGVYQEAAPIQIQKKNVSIIGQALRSCVVHPTVATQGDQSSGNHALFELNSGSYISNLTLTGMKAGTTGTNTLDSVLPAAQGWNFAFYSGATITKSPYIQNCTNFSDSEIDNSDLNAVDPAGGAGGDTDSAATGGGLLIDGSVVDSASPLRSMVADSYTHVGLNGPGILVTNNGYCQATSSYAFFNKYHIKTLNGGQANLAASTTDFGDLALVADGKSSTAIFSASTTASAADGDITFTIDAPVADSSWHGTANRPASNMLVTVNSITYPVLSAVANGSGWDVTISRPNPSSKSENLGLNGAVTSGATVDFFLRSMIASSGHTMEYVGSGTDYSALPENGGVPDDTAQITESNDGKIWTATTDHNGKFTVGPFEVDQRTGAVTIEAGSTITNIVDDTSPQLGGDLDANGNDIILAAGTASEPSLRFSGDANTGVYSPASDELDITVGGTAQLEVTSTGISTPGNITTTAGDITVTSGDITVTSGNATLSSGNLTVSSGNISVTGDVTATNFSGNGSSVTNLNASNLSSGTIPDARFPATLPAASGANLTSLNASELSSGTIPDARFPATLPAASGANLTDVDATTLDSIDSGSFLRSDASDTVTAQTTWSFGSTSQVKLNKPSSTDYCGISFSQSGDDRYLFFVNNADDGNLKIQTRENGTFIATALEIEQATGEVQFPSGVNIPDNEYLFLGTGNDAQFFVNGSHLYLNLGSGIGNFHIRDGTTLKYTFDDSGYFRAYGKVEGTTLVASSSANNAFIGDFNNYAGATTAYGLNVRAGSTSGTLAVWKNGSNTTVGSIYYSSGTVTYGEFTAHHPCILPSADSADAYPYGTLLEIVEVLEDLENSEGEVIQAGMYYSVQKSQSSHSRKLLGAYGSRLEDPDAPEDGNWHTAYILGDGHILVNNSGGNIEVGDGITSSATPGIGQKATETPSMIIGIAQEAVTFANDTEEKLVAVQYGLQQFTPWS